MIKQDRFVSKAFSESQLFLYQAGTQSDHWTKCLSGESTKSILNFTESKKEWIQNHDIELRNSLATSPVAQKREISKTPFRVLDAPKFMDDYYTNPLDWSSKNFIALGLGSECYISNLETLQVSPVPEIRDLVCSAKWSPDGTLLAIGLKNGLVCVVNTQFNKVANFDSHSGKHVLALDWVDNNTLISGGRDSKMIQHDVRDGKNQKNEFQGHTSQVCAIKCSIGQNVASSGNKDECLVFDRRKPLMPLVDLSNHHCAVVKALAWNPVRLDVLATGAGIQDKTIRLFNVSTGKLEQMHTTNSQISALVWNKNGREFATAHGYQGNCIQVWSAPKITKIATLSCHSERVLFMVPSPDGTSVCCGCPGEETLSFWKLWDPPVVQKSNRASMWDMQIR